MNIGQKMEKNLQVGFYATGEPFILPDLADYIRNAKDIGYTYVYLTSNGALATPERVREVIDAGLDSIKFSINAPQKKLYKFIHGKDDFDTVLEKQYAALNLYQSVSYFVLMDAENTLKNLNGDLTGTVYKGQTVESLHKEG